MIILNKVSKTYTSKKGFKTVALNAISLKLPSTGIVFIVGKSGAGKSTLLNVLGGLDYADSGEIIINGKSTKDFTKNEYDSYRNTYIGFVFQECYMLDNLTVGENIALAIKLQNRQPNDQEITKILSDVGLDGYLARRTNELSGGELQRVAIARALVKKPQIIIADEPTGALDSNTSTQIFETLKNLSKDHLILVVSHEQEFADNYADRVIEIKDGNIVSDVTRASKVKKVKKIKQTKQDKRTNPNISFENGSITINPSHKLSASDVALINDFIKNKDKATTTTTDKTTKEKEYFVPTKEIIEEGDSKPINLIKSKLPLKDSIRMGLNAMKHKKFKLIMSILLSVIAFTTLGISSLLTTFTNTSDLCAETFASSVINFARIRKTLSDEEGDGVEGTMSEDDQVRLNNETGLNFSILYTINCSIGHFPYETHTDPHHRTMFTNKAYVPNENFKDLNISSIYYDEPYELKAGEVAITEYVYEMFKTYKYIDHFSTDPTHEPIPINEPKDIIDKTLTYVEDDGTKIKLTIKDIYNTNFDRTDPFFKPYLNTTDPNDLYNAPGAAEYEDYERALANTLFMNKDDVKTKFIHTSERDYTQSLITGINKPKKEIMKKVYSFVQKEYEATKTDKEIHPDYTTAKYRLMDNISMNVVSAIEDTSTFSMLFLLIGVTFALFSGLLLANFIANSISYQRKEIGILRAIGARSTDVFKIYFSESFIIASINFVLSTLFTFLIFKGKIEASVLQLTNNIPIYTFTVLQVLLILVVSFLSVFLATFIPIRHIAKRKPIDTIRLK